MRLISLGINLYAPFISPKLPFLQNRSENFCVFSEEFMFPPEINRGTGVSLCTFREHGVA
jgi:hypothetical protein